MEKEFNLSDKMVAVDRYGEEFSREAISPKDVKEFIKLLKEELLKQTSCGIPSSRIIDKLAGDKLT